MGEAFEIAQWSTSLARKRAEYEGLPLWKRLVNGPLRADIQTLEDNIRRRSKAIDDAEAEEPVVVSAELAGGMLEVFPTRTVAGQELPENPRWYSPTWADQFVAKDPRNGPFTHSLSIVGPFAGAVSTPRVIAEPTGPILDAHFINGQWQMPATGRLPSNAGSGLSVARAEGGLAVPAAPALTPGTFTGNVGIQPYWEEPTALRRGALGAHSILKPKALGLETVALALVRLPNGRLTVYAAGSGASLSPDQVKYLRALGVPAENIPNGADAEFRMPVYGLPGMHKPVTGDPKSLRARNHAEQVIKRHLPAGAKVEAWGISWAGKQRPFACEDCDREVIEEPLQLFPMLIRLQTK
jgi:hypothetical protein